MMRNRAIVCSKAQDAAATAANKYGYDPRAAGAVTADRSGLSLRHHGKVSPISSINQLEAAIEAAAKSGALVVLKYGRSNCFPCERMQSGFEEAAKDVGREGLFFNVQCTDGKSTQKLCQAAKLRSVPAAHIYGPDGSLLAAVGAKDFRATLDEIVAKPWRGRRTKRSWRKRLVQFLTRRPS